MKHIFQYCRETNRRALNVWVIGCGGTGSRVLESLASMNHALLELGRTGLHVTVFDDDTVSPTNIGRQPFYPIDVGLHKAEVLVGRINMCYGFDWVFQNKRFDSSCVPENSRYWSRADTPDILIGCVDTVLSRKQILHAIQKIQESAHGNQVCYWLDCGNSAKTGQICLGASADLRKRESELFGDNQEQPVQQYLPFVVELFPELLENSFVEDNAPSCSMKEALEKQSLFINRAVAAQACAMLWDLLKDGFVTYCTAFVNLETGRGNCVGVDPKKWLKMGCKAAHQKQQESA